MFYSVRGKDGPARGYLIRQKPQTENGWQDKTIRLQKKKEDGPHKKQIGGGKRQSTKKEK